MNFQDHLKKDGQKKLLALDGGGIRGVITLEVLAKIEDILRKRQGKSQLVLADYFDYIAGTSTGALIATCLSLGMSVKAVQKFYIRSGPAMFDRAGLLRRFRYKFEDEKLSEKLRNVIGADTTFGSEKVRTLLMIVLRNATTDSPWPISNTPSTRCFRCGNSCAPAPRRPLISRRNSSASKTGRAKKRTSFSSMAESRCTIIPLSSSSSWPRCSPITCAGRPG
jgi:predicted acylesterase/phospholipase RssA